MEGRLRREHHSAAFSLFISYRSLGRDSAPAPASDGGILVCQPSSFSPSVCFPWGVVLATHCSLIIYTCNSSQDPSPELQIHSSVHLLLFLRQYANFPNFH